MTNHDIDRQFQFFAESDWNSQRIIYLDALERLAALTAGINRARAERDALAAQLAEVDAAVGDPEHPRFSQPEVRARMHTIVKVATANEDERDRILALHDAEVWDEGVSFGWHSTELRTDENPYRRAGL